MTDLDIQPEIADRLRSIAQVEQRPVNEILETMLDRYQATSPVDEPSKSYEEALQKLRPKFYERAQRYWKQTGNQERLQLTDQELDEQFWLFDSEGIPRLKSDQDEVDLPPDPLTLMAEAAQKAGQGSGRRNISSNFDDLVEETITKNHGG